MTTPEPIANETAASFPWAKRTTIRHRTREIVTCVRFSPDDATVIVAYFNGQVIAYDAQTFAVKFEFTMQVQEGGAGKGSRHLTVTSLSIRPTAKPALLVTTTAGVVEKYDLRTLEKLAQFVEDDNEVYASDYAPTGLQFATCGRDATVRIYDDVSNDLVRTFKLAPEFSANTAALRLFAVRFDPQDPTVLYSGGWSNTIHAHHLSEEASHNASGDHRHEYFGAYLTGDSMDIAGGKLVSASNRITDVLQIWDHKTLAPHTIPWPVKHQFLPNCARLSPDGKYFAVGGGGGLGLKEGCFVLDLESHKPVVDASLEKSVTACVFAKHESLVAFGDAEGNVHLYENRFAKK